MKFNRRLRRGNVHPITGSKFRKHSDSCRVQIITIQDASNNRTLPHITKTIRHWK
jgi:hypothetical protein